MVNIISGLKLLKDESYFSFIFLFDNKVLVLSANLIDHILKIYLIINIKQGFEEDYTQRVIEGNIIIIKQA